MSDGGSPVSNSAEITLYIYLVHGTWGRGFLPSSGKLSRKFWFHPDSDFTRAVSEQLTRSGFRPHFEPFVWSGSNSVQQREIYASRLASYLLEKHEGETDRVILIAHSHGGNLAARAIVKCGRHLNISLCTLATPFLEILFRRISKTESIAWKIAAILLPIMVLDILPLVYEIMAERIYNHKSFIFKIIDRLYLATSPSDLLLSLPFALLTYMLYRLLFALTKPKRRSVWLVRSTNIGQLHKHVKNLLILRAVDDEAALSLSASAFINRIITRFLPTLQLLSLAYFCLILLRIVIVVVFIRSGGIIYDMGIFRDYSALFAPIILSVFIALLAVSVPLALLSRAAYGRELAFAPISIQINLQSAPDLHRHCDILTIKQRRSVGFFGLRHGIYSDKPCVNAIVSWIKRCYSV